MYSNDLLIKIIIYINDNINKQITIDELSKVFFYNRYYIMKLFKKELNISIIDYINKTRIHNSLLDIRYSKKFFTYIAIKNGFYSLDYFSRVFKKVMKVSPLEYKYFCRRNKLSEEKYNIIIENSINLQLLKEEINTYINNKKPDKPKQKTLFSFKEK